MRRGGVVRDLPAAAVVPGDALSRGRGHRRRRRGAHRGIRPLAGRAELTGGSVAVDKGTGAAPSAGTTVVRGRGSATVTATDASSALGRIAGAGAASPLYRSRRRPGGLRDGAHEANGFSP
ncbi:hypothetical protein [Streptomyces sp. NPDC048338]|uniref:P-type ATPase n=1 Tax=Streptomyces sp. NPDC048338 TaxID=3365536 RepID=UPI003713BF57